MPCSGEPMNLRFGLDDMNIIPKRKFRWLFKISGISCQDTPTVRALPCRRGARPSLGWKEEECQHLNETIHFPVKPEWKPVQLHLYDLRCNANPVFDWIRQNQKNTASSGVYDPQKGIWNPIIDCGFKRNATLTILSGCGEALETWKFENCYPQEVNWGELDMDSNDIITVDMNLRYDRAYFVTI